MGFPSQDPADLPSPSSPLTSSSVTHRGQAGEQKGAALWPDTFCGQREGSGRRLEVLRKMKFGDHQLKLIIPAPWSSRRWLEQG